MRHTKMSFISLLFRPANYSACFGAAATTKLLHPSATNANQTRAYKPNTVDVHRHGSYKIRWHVNGTIARQKPSPDVRAIVHLPEFRPPNEWDPRKAAFGQNDFIDILGDGNLHPRDLLQVPGYLKGKTLGGLEVRRLLWYQINRHHITPYRNPNKWYLIQKRIRYLIKYHTRHQNHKDWKMWYERE